MSFPELMALRLRLLPGVSLPVIPSITEVILEVPGMSSSFIPVSPSLFDANALLLRRCDVEASRFGFLSPGSFESFLLNGAAIGNPLQRQYSSTGNGS